VFGEDYFEARGEALRGAEKKSPAVMAGLSEIYETVDSVSISP
jgi:hypothetical protein